MSSKFYLSSELYCKRSSVVMKARAWHLTGAFYFWLLIKRHCFRWTAAINAFKCFLSLCKRSSALQATAEFKDTRRKRGSFEFVINERLLRFVLIVLFWYTILGHVTRYTFQANQIEISFIFLGFNSICPQLLLEWRESHTVLEQQEDDVSDFGVFCLFNKCEFGEARGLNPSISLKSTDWCQYVYV